MTDRMTAAQYLKRVQGGSALEEMLAQQVTLIGLPEPVRELKFHPTRRWRFDFAWPAHKLAVEVEGAVWANGRHTRGAGFIADCEKYNAATVLGWRVVRVTGNMVRTGEAVTTIQKALES